MVGNDDEPGWHDQQPVLVAAGVAAVVLVAILIYAVINTSDSSRNPGTVPIPPSSATPSTYTTSPTTTTSYTVPSVQTSQDNPVIGPPPSPTDEPPDSETATDAPTTTANPYLTTTPTNAGHI
ncbi:MAG: hypothetical protein QOD39_2328 [Mycobacterium sp.]|nr:hypothetical protein [Mycobacterium sp.]